MDMRLPINISDQFKFKNDVVITKKDIPKLKILVIDDERTIEGADHIAKDYDSGIKALKTMGPWDLLYLDHDYKPEHASSPLDNHPDNGTAICKWLAKNQEYLPRIEINIVSTNPIGVIRMGNILMCFYNDVNGSRRVFRDLKPVKDRGIPKV